MSVVVVSFSALAVAAIGALLVYLVDRDEFSSFGTALWWSIVTVGTVGYGDIVPTSDAGRVVAAAVIIFSMAFFPVLTGLITTLIMRQAQQPADAAAEQDAKGRQAELLKRLASIDERLTDLDERLARLDERAG